MAGLHGFDDQHPGRTGRRSLRHALAIVGSSGLVVAASCGGGGGTSGGTGGATATAASTTAVTSPPQSTVAGGGGVAGGQRNPGDAYGEYGVYERVSFPRGTTGTTVSDGVVRGTVNGYLFGAAGGQKFILNLVSPNASFDVYAPDDTLLVREQRYAVISPLPAEGDYLVVVSATFGNAAFDLLTEITSPAATPVVPATCANYVEFVDDFPMRQCHKGAEVEAVQRALVALGYGIDVDGFFGPGTATALQQHFTDGTAVLSRADYQALV